MKCPSGERGLFIASAADTRAVIKSARLETLSVSKHIHRYTMVE
jgi:hypothetical protein